MARIRTIKPEFWSDEKFAECSARARLTFLGLVSALADDEGRMRGHARLVRAAVYPYDDTVTTADVDADLTQLERMGRIIRYTVGGESYIAVRNFKRHQKIDRPSESRLPAPPEGEARPSGDDSTSPRRALDEQSMQEGEQERGVGGGVVACLPSSPSVRACVVRWTGDDQPRPGPAAAPSDDPPLVGVIVGDIAGAAVQWTAALNRGVTDTHGEQPVPVRHDAQLEAAEALLRAGIDVGWGAEWLYHRAKRSTRRSIPRSLAYVAPGLLDAWRAEHATADAVRHAAAFVPGTDPTVRAVTSAGAPLGSRARLTGDHTAAAALRVAQRFQDATERSAS